LWTPDTRIAGKRTDVDDFSLLVEEWFVKSGKEEEGINAEYAESAEDAERRESGLDAFAAKG
jgi:hypothetical protein